MPLILAIEPDRRQAAQLSTVIRKRVGAELILVDTTERALDAIGNRMPDLVLVPALLSPQDDAALAAALRVIAAAARVQMLTIPVLGTPRPAAASGGVLSVLRRVKSRGAEPDGCDPNVFAEQIASYLERAAQERPNDMAEYAATELVAADTPAPIDVTSVETMAAGETEMAEVANAINQEWLDPLPDEVVESATAGAPDESVSFALEEAVRALFADPAPAAFERGPVVYEPAAAEPVAVDELAADELVANEFVANEFVANKLIADEPIVSELAAKEPVAVDDLTVVSFEPPAVVAEVEKDEWVAVEELIAALQVMPLAAIAVTAEDDWIALPPAESPRGVEPVVYLIDEPEGNYPPVAASALLPASPASPGPSATAATPSASSATTPGPKSEHEWVALIESLRHDVERLRGERSEKPGRKAAPPPAKPARPERAPKAVQDEWGFFDPQQCGFAALLAKLDEVTESEDGRVNH